MDQFDIRALITQITLNQREVTYAFRKATAISRSELELLVFAQSELTFTIYQAQKRFSVMNIQQVRLGVRKLALLNAIEQINAGTKARPAVYMIRDTGHELLRLYFELWSKLL